MTLALKPSLLILVTFTMGATLHAQWSLGSYDLSGPVKKMTVQEIDFRPDGSLAPENPYQHQEVYEFNPGGYVVTYSKNAFEHFGKTETLKAWLKEDSILIREEVRLEGALTEIRELEYDSRGNRVNECQTRIEGRDTSRYQFLTRYDAHGRQREHQVYRNDTLLRWGVSTYDARGNNILDEYFDAQGLRSWDADCFDLENNKITHIYSERPFSFVPASRYAYNEKGQRVKTWHFNAQGQLDYEITHRYHPNGTLAEDSTYTYPIKITKPVDYMDYFHMARGGRTASWYIMAYDSLGNTTHIKTNNVGPVQIQTWTYTYDHHGSWLTKTWGKPGFPISMTVRTLEYY